MRSAWLVLGGFFIISSMATGASGQSDVPRDAPVEPATQPAPITVESLQREIADLKAANAQLLAEIDRLRAKNVASASSNHKSSKTYYSLAQILNSVPSSMMIDDRSQRGSVRDQLRMQWITQNVPGSLLDVQGLVSYLNINGQFTGGFNGQNAGDPMLMAVVGKLSQSEILRAADLKGGDNARIRGVIKSIKMSGEPVIELEDISLEKLVPTIVATGKKMRTGQIQTGKAVTGSASSGPLIPISPPIGR